MSTQHHDPLYKRLLRSAWRGGLSGISGLSAREPFGETEPKVFYGGARAGNVGGTLVKVAHLQKYFPQHLMGFNTVYSMSNTPYLSAPTLDRLKKRGVVLIHNQNGLYYPGWFPDGWRQQNERMAIAYHRADHVFYQSEFCRRCAEEFLGERTGEGEILFNATDLDHYKPAAAPLPESPFRFLTSGKFSDSLAYRLTSSIHALGQCVRNGYDFSLYVAGWVEAGALEAAREAAGLENVTERVRFSGAYAQEEAPDIYRGAHAYLMTKYLDPCPNTVIEALASGLPVVYSASGGVPEMVGADAGAGVEAVEDFSAIREPGGEKRPAAVIAVSKQHEAMARAARARAEEKFDIRKWIARHDTVMRSLLETRR